MVIQIMNLEIVGKNRLANDEEVYILLLPLIEKFR